MTMFEVILWALTGGVVIAVAGLAIAVAIIVIRTALATEIKSKDTK